jgi:hypothetical protein
VRLIAQRFVIIFHFASGQSGRLLRIIICVCVSKQEAGRAEKKELFAIHPLRLVGRGSLSPPALLFITRRAHRKGAEELSRVSE